LLSKKKRRGPKRPLLLQADVTGKKLIYREELQPAFQEQGPEPVLLLASELQPEPEQGPEQELLLASGLLPSSGSL
jgi:hypothetical protein